MSLLLHQLALALLQGGDAPFAKVPLNLEDPLLPQASAFELVMLSVAVFLLGAIVLAGFLAVAKLGALERTVEAQHRRLRDELAPLLARAAESSAPSEGDGTEETAVLDALEGLRGAVERGFEAAARRAEGGGADALGAQIAELGAALRASADRGGGGVDAGALEAGFARLEKALEKGLQAAPRAGGPATAPAATAGPADLLERIHSALGARGFHDVTVVTDVDALEPEALQGGALVVEAWRAGAIHKGRVLLRGGQIADVQMRPSHPIFP